MNWSGLLVAAYLTVGCLETLGNLVFVLMAGRFTSINPMGATLAALVESRSIEIGRARNLTRIMLETLPQVVTWPVISVAFRRNRRSFPKVVNLRLRWPLDVTISIWLLVFSAFIALLAEFNGANLSLRVACYAVIGATIAVPARWVIDGASLRQEMRTTLRNPIILFALIVMSNFLALSIAASVLLKVPAQSRFLWESVWPEARQVLKFGHITAIWQARPTRVTEIVVAGAALAVYALLISQLSNPLRFRRTDDDRIEISIRLLLAGENDSAERWLQSVQTNNPKSLPEYVRAQGMLAIKTGDFALALQRAHAMASLLRQRIVPMPPDDKDDGRLLLAAWADFFTRVDRGELYSQVVSYIIDDGISDPCLTCVVPALLFFEHSEAGDSRLAVRLVQGMERARLRAQAAGRPDANLEAIALERTRRVELPGGMTDPPYPLTLATFEGLRKHLPEAAEHLLSMRRTRRLPGRIVKRVLSGRVVVEDARHERGFSESREVAKRDVIGLLNEARSWPIAEFPWWLRGWLETDIDQRLQQPIRRWAGKEIEAALLDLHRFLTGLINTAEFALKSSDWDDLIGGGGSLDMTRALKAVASHQPTSSIDPNKAEIFNGPIGVRSREHFQVFRYCVRLGSRGRHRDIYVFIDKDAPRSIMNTAGRAALEETLNRGDAPPRIIIDSHGEIVSKRS